MYQCGGRNVTQSFCTNSSMYDFSNLPIGGTKTCQKKGLFLFVLRMDSYNGNVRIPIVRTRISFPTWQCFFPSQHFTQYVNRCFVVEDLLDCHRLDGPHQLGERFASGRSVAEVAITGTWWPCGGLGFDVWNLLVKQMKISSDKPIDLFTGAMCFFVRQQVLNLYTLGLLG